MDENINIQPLLDIIVLNIILSLIEVLHIFWLHVSVILIIRGKIL